MVLKGSKKDKTNENDSENEIMVICACGTHGFRISAPVDFVCDEYYFELWTDNRSEKEHFFKRLWKKLKFFWTYIVRDREYLFTDVILDENDFDELIKTLQEVKDKREKYNGGEK